MCWSVAQLVELGLWKKKKEAETLLDQNCKRSLTESFIKSLAELTSRNPWLPALLYSTGVNSFTERHLKHLTLSLLAWSSSFSGQTNQKRSLSHLQKEDPNLPCVDRQLNLTVLHVPSVFWGKRVRNGDEGIFSFVFLLEFCFAATWQEGEWRHWGSRISGFSSVISEFCYISDSVAISTLNCCTFY